MIGSIRVMLVDDHAVLRAGLKALLNAEPTIRVVSEVANGAEAIRSLEDVQVDVAVVDLTMPGMGGLELIHHITRHYPHVRTLVLTMHSEEQFIIGAIKAGASGYVMKSAADVELIQAIHQVSVGESYYYGQAMQLLLDYHRGGEVSDGDEELSEREHEVLVLTVQGYTSREIGERLFISAKTVDTYRQRLMQKLDLNHRADLVQYALRNHLLDVPGDARALSGVAAQASAHPAASVTWDRVADVVVVGSGTGLMAALRAADAGLSTLVLEKADFIGGTMAISGGGLWIPNNYRMRDAGIADSREEALEYIRHATLGQSDPELCVTFVDYCNQAIEFLREVGIEWDFMPNFNDYYPELPGGRPRGRTLRPMNAWGEPVAGPELTEMMYQASVARGVEFVLNAAAHRLVVDDDGTIVGVVTEVDGREAYFGARRGVVLAAGGFDHNRTMVKNFLRGPLYYTSAVPANTGDGHVMGMALGASLRNMNEWWGWPVFFDPEQGQVISALATELGKPGAIVVNRRGERFMNEAGAYDSGTRAFFAFDNGTYEYNNIPGYVIVDAGHRSRYTLAGHEPESPLPGWIKQADSLDELAAALEIDAETLARTVATFNESAARGLDPEFHRGESEFDLMTAGDPARADIPNSCLAPIIQPPYYGAPIWPGALGTSGGLQTNTQAQVLNVWGKVIRGLYAVGNTAGSPLAGGYPGGGGTLSAGLTFAYIAANTLAATEEGGDLGEAREQPESAAL
ncbi:MAG: FAD-binding protein [Anaerolineae bacterium]|nr:FAD-binding protein [Anaerolineae bacterium]